MGRAINTRAATTEDFKTGVVLFDSEGNAHRIADKYSDGIWNTKSCKVVFENEAKFYKVQL